MKAYTQIINSLAFQLTSLGLLTALSRLPFKLDLLNSYDAINYALAITQFDVRHSQPQSPGYLLYILIARGINWFVDSPLKALYFESLIFSALAVLAIFLAGREIYNHQVGLIAALFLATNAFFWCFSVIPTPYTGDFFASALIGWLSYRMWKIRDLMTCLITTICLGLIAGYRLQTLIFLFPIFLFGLWQFRSKPAFVVLNLLICFGIGGVFLIATIMLSGGRGEYFNSLGNTVPLFKNAYYFTRFMLYFPRYYNNLYLTATYLFRAMGELLCVMVLIGFVYLPYNIRFWKNKELTYLFLWIIPTILVYFLIWPGNPGTILVCTPPLFILAAYGMHRLLQLPKLKPYMISIFLFILGAQIIIFTLSPVKKFSDNYREFDNWNGIKERVDQIKDRISLVQQSPVEGTLIVAYDIRHIQYYLPQYLGFSFPTFKKENPELVSNVLISKDGKLSGKENVLMNTLLPTDIRRLILFDVSPSDAKVDAKITVEYNQNGHSIYILYISPYDCLDWTSESITVDKCSKQIID
ncbi:MAG: DUF2723 domain-containing protein [Anaerolineaceae bacterium]